MNAVFLDTVGLLALWDTADQWHAAAERAFANLLQDRRRVVATPLVLLECGNAAARRPYRAAVNPLREALAVRGDLIVPTEEEWAEGWRAYHAGTPGQAGIVDHVSFVVMRRLALSEAFTNDRHFQAAGFRTLF